MEVSVSQAQGRVPVTVFHITGPVTTNQELEALARAHLLRELPGRGFVHS